MSRDGAASSTIKINFALDSADEEFAAEVSRHPVFAVLPGTADA
ncbi:hypothetical protein [Actinoallomurus spadix]|uniref:Uncharacterized protein n=1 Tax=Actinoallomurus spadix TaxID=79912 RepID=A0ABN0WYF3_9ACTN|nr:hypothetical protein [Actinoallomurus spadix]